MIYFIIPVKDEEKTISATVTNLIEYCEKEFEDFFITFIDDGSKDATPELITNIPHNKKEILINRFDKGKGSALKTALLLSNNIKLGSPDDLIVFLDGDGQIALKDLKVFLANMAMNDSDVVIGNKRHDYSLIKYSLGRKIVSKGYNFLVRKLFGFNIRDTQCGLKLFKKYTLDAVIDKITIKKYAFDVELLVSLRAVGYRITDAPVRVKEQQNKGSVSFNSIASTFLDTMFIWTRKLRGYYG